MVNKNNTTVLEAIIKSFTTLNIDLLNNLPDNSKIIYDDHITDDKGYLYESDNCTKKDFIKELKNIFDEIKSLGIKNLIVKPSKCKYCYLNYLDSRP